MNNNSEGKFLSTEGIISGVIVGGLLMAWSIKLWISGEHIIHDPIAETLFVAIYLTGVVGYCFFKLPTFFASSNQSTAIFALALFCGHISLFFDSFAVVLLLGNLVLLPILKAQSRFKFNAFTFKTICSFNALTVGGGFFIGELWGLPHFISSGMDNAVAGFPLLIVLTPYSIFTSWIAKKYFPVKIEKVKYDKKQLRGTIEIVFFLTLIIVTHRPILSIGALLFYSALRGKTPYLVSQFLHELKHGAFSALGLIMAALIINEIGWGAWIQEHVKGVWITLLSIGSSPFAGAILPGATDPSTFYQNLSYIMVGAPVLVSSSLVAIIVFRDTIDYEDLPPWMQRFASKKKGYMQEALAYTIIVLPLAAGLAILLYIANYFDVFASIYKFIS